MDFVKRCKCEDSVNNVKDYPLLKDLLPENYSYRICEYFPDAQDSSKFDTRFRINCNTKEEIEDWLKQFEKKSKTTFKSSQTFSKNSSVFVFKVALRCHHNTQPKSHKVQKPHAKHTDCPATMRITVKATGKSKKYKSVDCHISELATLVILHHKHNHDIHNAEALKYRQPSEEVRKKFLQMFEAGYLPSRALDIHKADLYKEYKDDYCVVAGDRAYCPDMFWVYHLYYNVFKHNCGSSTSDGMLKSLETFVAKYNSEIGENCADFQCLKDNNFVIAIMSPLMKRILKTMKTSTEVVFVDSSSNVDRFGCRMFLLTINTSAGGFPIGVVVSSLESQEVIYEGLTLYKNFIKPDMFNSRGQRGPQVFMADDSASERSALAKAFPDSSILLCIFHILRAAWQFLWSSSTGIELKDRKELFYLIKNMVCASNESMLESAHQTLLASSTSKKYLKFLNYTEKLYKRQVEWALFYRKSILRGQNTYNLCEAALRVLKDKILMRIKAYNVIQLFGFLTSDLNNFYVRKAIDVANGSVPSYFKQNSKASEKKQNPLRCEQVSDNYFEVINTNNSQKYFVEMNIGLCSCTLGQSGVLCKHQQYIAIKYNKHLSFTLPTSESAQKEFCCIVTGSANVPDDWSKQLTEVTAFDIDDDQFTKEFCYTVAGSANSSDDWSKQLTETISFDMYDDRSTAGSDISNSAENDYQKHDNLEARGKQVSQKSGVFTVDIVKKIEEMCDVLKSKALNNSEILEAAEQMVTNFKKIETDAQLISACSNFGKCSGASSKRIGVESSAVL